MGAKIGSEALGKLYGHGKVKKRREWRGFRDTFYDFFCWLGILLMLARFLMVPRNLRALFRYRWMSNYVAVPAMIDKVGFAMRKM